MSDNQETLRVCPLPGHNTDWDAYEREAVLRRRGSYAALPEGERLSTAIEDGAHWNRMYRELAWESAREAVASSRAPAPTSDALAEARDILKALAPSQWEGKSRFIEVEKQSAIRALTRQPAAQVAGEPLITFDDHALFDIAARPVIGTETGTPIVELAEWERDGMIAKIRNLQAALASTPCPNCADMQRALTQTARANRTLEKQCAEAQKGREAIIREAAKVVCIYCANTVDWLPPAPDDYPGAGEGRLEHLPVSGKGQGRGCHAWKILALINPKGRSETVEVSLP